MKNKRAAEIQERVIRFKNNQDYIVSFMSGYDVNTTQDRWDNRIHTFTKEVFATIYKTVPYKNTFGVIKTKRVLVSSFSVKVPCDECQYEIKAKLIDDSDEFYDTLNKRFWSLSKVLEISWIDEKIRENLDTELNIHHKAENQKIHYAIGCGVAAEHLEEIEEF
jgi:hypothetical protein